MSDTWDLLIHNDEDSIPEYDRVQPGAITEHEGEWVLVYNAADSSGSESPRHVPAIATSTDGYEWDSYAGNPIIEETDDWAEQRCRPRGLIWDDEEERWILVFNSIVSDSNVSGKRAIGLAFAADLFGEWTYYTGNPIIEVGDLGDWGAGDQDRVYAGGIAKENGTWYIRVAYGESGVGFNGGMVYGTEVTNLTTDERVPDSGPQQLFYSGEYWWGIGTEDRTHFNLHWAESLTGEWSVTDEPIASLSDDDLEGNRGRALIPGPNGEEWHLLADGNETGDGYPTDLYGTWGDFHPDLGDSLTQVRKTDEPMTLDYDHTGTARTDRVEISDQDVTIGGDDWEETIVEQHETVIEEGVLKLTPLPETPESDVLRPESNDLDHFGGMLDGFEINTNLPVLEERSLKVDRAGTGSEHIGSTSGLNDYPDVGETHSFFIHLNDADDADAASPAVIFAGDSEGDDWNNGYRLDFLAGDGDFRVLVLEDGNATVLDTVDSPGFNLNDWMVCEILHEADGTLTINLYDSDDIALYPNDPKIIDGFQVTDETHITDESYDNTGIGFFQYEDNQEAIAVWRTEE